MKLRETAVLLTTGSTVARSGATNVWDTAVDSDASKQEGSATQYHTPPPMPGGTIKTDHLQRVGFTTPARLSQQILHSIIVRVVATAGPDTVAYADSVCLVKAGVILTSVDNGETIASPWTGDETREYTFTPAQLATLGISRVPDLLSSPADFGAALGFTSDDTIAGTGHHAHVDELSLIFVTLEPEEDMDLMTIAKSGGWRCLLEEALPSVAASAQIFENAPNGTQWIELRINVADLVIRYNTRDKSSGSWADVIVAATTSNGSLFYAGERVVLPLNAQAAKLVRAIQSGGTTTGRIAYFGRDIDDSVS